MDVCCVLLLLLHCSLCLLSFLSPESFHVSKEGMVFFSFPFLFLFRCFLFFSLLSSLCSSSRRPLGLLLILLCVGKGELRVFKSWASTYGVCDVCCWASLAVLHPCSSLSPNPHMIEDISVPSLSRLITLFGSFQSLFFPSSLSLSCNPVCSHPLFACCVLACILSLGLGHPLSLPGTMPSLSLSSLLLYTSGSLCLH